jgi:ADP-heptose:LPS heptosyltransferase
MSPSVQRALIIRVSALGDVVLTEPVARALRAAHPGIAVDLATDLRYAELMGRAGFDRVIPIDRGSSRTIDGSYDVVIDLQGKLRTRALARRVRAEKRVTLRKRTAGRALLSLFGWDPPIDDRHSTSIYLGTLGRLGISPEIDRAPRLARSAPAEGLAIGLAPGATHATKRWPAERFAELADRLQAALPEARFVPIGGATDRALLRDLIQSAKRARFEPDTTDLDVAQLTDRLERLSLLISVDTGPAHIAAALGVPVVVLFGPTSPVRWGPIGERHRSLSLALPCAPCSNIGGDRCPLPGSPHSCMRDLGVDRIQEAALAALGRRA